MKLMTDVLGRYIEEGDLIAWPRRRGSDTWLSVGKVRSVVHPVEEDAFHGELVVDMISNRSEGDVVLKPRQTTVRRPDRAIKVGG